MFWLYCVCVLGVGVVRGSNALGSDGVMSRIYDGKQLRYDVHKYLVALSTWYSHDFGPTWCSGSIIQQSWILTSAHCVDDSSIDDIYVVHYMGVKGSLDLIQKVDLSKIFLHPSYKPHMKGWMEMRAFDLALVKTKAPIEFNEYVASIKMSWKVPVGKSAVMAAYGLSEYSVVGHKEGVVTVEECEDEVAGVVCSTSLVRAADGDSGGALVSRGRLVGVISASCSHVELRVDCVTIYASLAHSKDWITSVLQSQ